jgi:Na+(H+)/acetate symporter ActP
LNSWKKILALSLGLPSTIIGSFILLQHLVDLKIIDQTVALILLVVIILFILGKMIGISWKKK